MAATHPETPEEIAVKTDFRANIWSVFQELYEDRWDSGMSPASCIRLAVLIYATERWRIAIGRSCYSAHALAPRASRIQASIADHLLARFEAAHDPAVVQRFWVRAKLPSWNALEAQFRKGPPPFLRPGWKSPLLGRKVDLRWLDTGKFEPVKGNMDGWRTAKVLVIELWASYVLCSPLAVAHGASRGQHCPRGVQWESRGHQWLGSALRQLLGRASWTWPLSRASEVVYAV